MTTETIRARPTAEELLARLAELGYDGHVDDPREQGEPYLNFIAVYSYAGDPALFGHPLFTIRWTGGKDGDPELGWYRESGRPRR